ncbi:MAG: multicopper oxidase family protein [Rhodospirillaceae bacterium]|nr:multicopper oxidase family protein [Rhodospirillaceae bacterium]
MKFCSRRTFLAHGAAALAAVPFTIPPRALTAQTPARILRAERRIIEVGGRAASVFALLNENGDHGLIFDRTEPFRVQLENRIGSPTLVHWHGLTPPWEQDGVPDQPLPALLEDETRLYDFPLREAGTYWMHSHLGLQEQALLAAPLIVRDPDEAAIDRQEVVIMLHDFSFRPAEEILASLESGGHMMAADGSMTSSSDPHAGHEMGNGVDPMAEMGETGSMMRHANDIEFDAYLANDRTLDDPEIVSVERSGKIRLRIVNAAAATNFLVDTGSLPASLVAVDGRDVRPVAGTRFPVAISQRIDIDIIIPAAGGSFPILALREGDRARTGIVLATANATVSKLSGLADEAAGFLDLGLEQRLAATAPLPEQTADRNLTADLVGGMGDYRWGLDLRDTDGGRPMELERGERIEIAFRNRTGMSHPMHLHGHGFQIVAIGETRFAGARRDTVLVPPGSSVTIAFDADNPGRWMLHCHHLYHMAAGMMTTLNYRGVG